MSRFWLLLMVWCGAAQTQALCFVLAENYYEQVYCELQAKGEGSALPRFHEFKNNPPVTQALLLKRPAGRIGITLKMPVETPPTQSIAGQPELAAVSAADCRPEARVMLCGDKRYQLVGNQANSHLAEGALTAANQLLLPRYQGQSQPELAAYLAEAYRQYLDKMLSIGLGGSTISFPKFAYLYQDLTTQGVDFVERSQIVFNYLKADKKRLKVSETVAPSSAASFIRCKQFGDQLLACDDGSKNYLYLGDNN